MNCQCRAWLDLIQMTRPSAAMYACAVHGVVSWDATKQMATQGLPPHGMESSSGRTPSLVIYDRKLKDAELRQVERLYLDMLDED